MTQGESIRVSNMFLCLVHSKFREKKFCHLFTYKQRGLHAINSVLQVPKKKVLCSSSIPTKGSDQSSKQLIIHGQKTTTFNPIKAALLHRAGNLTPFPIADCNKTLQIMKQLPDT